MRKSIIVLLSGMICLLGLTPVLGQECWSTVSEYEKATGQKIEKFDEAPMLRVKVAAGEIPPVEKRLPEEPLVIEPLEEIGQYGGTLNALATDDWGWDDGNIIRGFGTSLCISPDLKGIVPNIAKDWKLSEDGKTFTLYLRKGTKWSDGAPFTADDILFWWEDVALNKELTPAVWPQYIPGGKLWEVEKIDDYTVRFHFAVPQPFVAIEFFHFTGGEGGKFYPKHYLKKYHAKYTSAEKLKELYEKEGFKKWTELFREKSKLVGSRSYFVDIETPTLRPWLLKERGIDWWLLERNPYYFAVDTTGNQLPYIDEIFITNVGNIEVYNAKIVSGEADFAAMATSFANYTLYVEGAEKGDYRVLAWNSGKGTEVSYVPNQNVGDPTLRGIFQDVRFRQALSVAIDRDDINEALYFGLAISQQFTVIPDSKYYEEEFARAYAQYDPEMANRLLDEMGLDKRDKEGYRLRLDGKRLSLLVEYYEGEIPKGPPSELVKEYWEAIGIDVALKLVDQMLLQEHYSSNEIEIGVWEGEATSDIYFPAQIGSFGPVNRNCTWARSWGIWYETGGEEGEEPPEEVKKNMKRWEKITTITEEEEIIRLTKEILRSQAENLWVIGTVGYAPVAVLVKNSLRNVLETNMWGWDNLMLNNARPEQFFFKEK